MAMEGNVEVERFEDIERVHGPFMWCNESHR